MKVMILGADGYLGWPTVMYLAIRGHRVMGVDSYIKREWETRTGAHPVQAVASLEVRAQKWNEVNPGEAVSVSRGDITDAEYVATIVSKFRPDAIVHYGEQPSAPFSMIDVRHAAETQVNNIVGTLNVLFAMRDYVPDAQLVKLGTMGEYGTPNIAIEEGYLTVTHKGRVDTLPFPKQPGSFYHLSKVHDSANMLLASKIWGLRITDLNQGIVYGVRTDEMTKNGASPTSFHYDAVFGTVLNRFCVQAVAGVPLTVYGTGDQQRAFLNIRDTLQCVEIALNNPPPPGIPRVFNQFTETFSVMELAGLVREAAGKVGMSVSIQRVDNPRVELDHHFYEPVNDNLLRLGLEPRFLSTELVESIFSFVQSHTHAIDRRVIAPQVSWTARWTEVP